MTDIKLFTAEEVAEIAANTNRIPSSNDSFIRYEDHMNAMLAEKPQSNLLNDHAKCGDTYTHMDTGKTYQLKWVEV